MRIQASSIAVAALVAAALALGGCSKPPPTATDPALAADMAYCDKLIELSATSVRSRVPSSRLG